VLSGPDKGTSFTAHNTTATQLTGKAGDNYTCTFTNTLKTTPPPSKATLELRKLLVPSSDSGRFNLIARLTAGAVIQQTNGVGNGGTSGRFTIPVGQQLTVEETAANGSNLGNYTTDITCTVLSGPDKGTSFTAHNTTATQLTGKAGDNYSCTFTNTRAS
jgi:hypothetical protein